jgi:cation diffusion facilitator family transporter
VIIKIWPEYKNADPICTVLFSIIVVATTAKILRDTLNILLESNVESTKNYDSIFNDLFNMEHVVKVHDLHIWSLTTDQKILTVHLAVDSSIKGKDFSKNYYTTYFLSLFFTTVQNALINDNFTLRFFFEFIS